MSKKKSSIAANVTTLAKAAKATIEDKKEEKGVLKCGYIVGLDQEGKFVFNLLGKPLPGLLELLGLHGYASNHIQKMTNEVLEVGDRFTHGIVNKAVQVLDEKLSALVDLLTPIDLPMSKEKPEMVSKE